MSQPTVFIARKPCGCAFAAISGREADRASVVMLWLTEGWAVEPRWQIATIPTLCEKHKKPEATQSTP